MQLCTLCVFFRDELGFLNCDDICMCVMNEQFELLEFVWNPFMFTCNMIFLSLCVACVYAVVGRLRCGCGEYMAGHASNTRSSCIASRTVDVLGMRGVGGVYERCMCLAQAVWVQSG